MDDRLFASPPRERDAAKRVLFAAPSTPRRERLLTPAKHAHDVLHVAHGITPATLPALLGAADVAIALRPDDRPGFDHAVALHLAAGHLVLTDPLDPAHGVEEGIDVLACGDGEALARAIAAARSAPHIHHRVRVRGHLKAQRFRASRVWPELIADLRADLEALARDR